MNAIMLRQMHGARSTPLRAIAGDDVMPYVLTEELLTAHTELPYNVNLLAFHDYEEEQVLERVKQLGWEAPADTDGNSTNCLLNSYANRAHLRKYGFHPYAFEVAGLVRRGAMTREAGLKSLAELGGDETASWVAERLGIETTW